MKQDVETKEDVWKHLDMIFVVWGPRIIMIEQITFANW